MVSGLYVIVNRRARCELVAYADGKPEEPSYVEVTDVLSGLLLIETAEAEFLTIMRKLKRRKNK